LLRPQLREQDSKDDQLSIPVGFLNDTEHNVYSEIVRDFGQIDLPTSDWYSICNLDRSKSEGIQNLVLFTDHSGSTTKYDVEVSNEVFMAKAELNGFNVIKAVVNEFEDYISPCLSTSIEGTGSGPGDLENVTATAAPTLTVEIQEGRLQFCSC